MGVIKINLKKVIKYFWIIIIEIFKKLIKLKRVLKTFLIISKPYPNIKIRWILPIFKYDGFVCSCKKYVATQFTYLYKMTLTIHHFGIIIYLTIRMKFLKCIILLTKLKELMN